MKRLLAAPLAALAALAVAGCSSPPTTPAAPPSSSATSAALTLTFTMTGAFDVFVDPKATTLTSAAACKGSGASSDISDNTTVSVFNAQGKLIATGGLSNGVYASTPIGSACTFTLTVDDVPAGLPNYSVEIGQRGEKVISSIEAHGHVFMSDGP